MQALARAKINLALHITGKRADGYHLMESLVAFADVGDVVYVRMADTLSLHVEGPFANACGPLEQNLALRAAKHLQQILGETRGAEIHVSKQLPVGAGLGGGSADAATVCSLLLTLWGRIMPMNSLAQSLLVLGADMPMCLASKALIARGIGEDITVLPAFPSLPVVLCWPAITLETARVYGEYQHENRALLLAPNVSSVEALLQSLAPTRNQLQRAAIACAPEVAEALLALETLPAQPLVRMSGSGACCVAYFTDDEDAQAAALHLQARYPEWWIRAAQLG